MKKILLISSLVFSLNSYSQLNREANPRKEGLMLSIGGAAFTVAAILEGNGMYGTYQTKQINPTTQSHKYVTQPFLRQTPRNIMFGIGISFSITGLVLINK
jgi:hypothetical protein